MAMLSSLTNRIFLASTLLATVSIGFAVYFVSSQLRSEAEAELQRDLREAARLVEQQRASLFETFTRTARLIADLPKFKAAVETRDAPTVEPIARDYQQQAGVGSVPGHRSRRPRARRARRPAGRGEPGLATRRASRWRAAARRPPRSGRTRTACCRSSACR